MDLFKLETLVRKQKNLEYFKRLSSPRYRRDRVPLARPRSLQGVSEATTYTRHSHRSNPHEEQQHVEVAHQFAAAAHSKQRASPVCSPRTNPVDNLCTSHPGSLPGNSAVNQVKSSQELYAEDAIATTQVALFRQAVAQDFVSTVMAVAIRLILAHHLHQADVIKQQAQHRCTAKAILYRAWRSHRARKFSRALVELVLAKRAAEAEEEDLRIDGVYRVSMAEKLAREWAFLSSLRSPRNVVKLEGSALQSSVLLPVSQPSVSHQLLKKLLSGRVNRLRVAKGIGMLSRRERDLWAAELRECEDRRFSSRETSAGNAVVPFPTLCPASGVEQRERVCVPSTDTKASIPGLQPTAAVSSPKSAIYQIPSRPPHAPPSAVRVRPLTQPRSPHIMNGTAKAKGPTREVLQTATQLVAASLRSPSPSPSPLSLSPTPPREPRPRPGDYCLTSADSDFKKMAPVYFAPMLALQRQFGITRSEGDTILVPQAENWEDRALCYRDTRNEVLALGRGGWGGCFPEGSSALAYDSSTSAAVSSIAARAVVAHAVAMAIEFHLTRGRGPMIRPEESSDRRKPAQYSPAEMVAQLRALPRQGKDGRVKHQVIKGSPTAASSSLTAAWERIVDDVYSRSLAHHKSKMGQRVPRRLCLAYGDYGNDRSGGGWIVSLDGHTKLESHTCPLLTI